MKWLLRKCPSCISYTLKQQCPKCGMSTVTPHPPKFSPHDKYAKFRQTERVTTSNVE
ncbi:MAG TPA: RNA-protein complex protein Nop10 [Methylomirabilota bacterium]|nr:RNA-protein complex protein Nop10 [Methylomirabilota bacterium]